MCDYSLHQSLTRLAQENERLVVHRFPGGSLGLASPAELAPVQHHPKLPAPRALTWSAIAHWFKQMNQDAPAAPAVCIPPGARLALHDIPTSLQKELDVTAEEVVTFDQLSADAYSYRDCVRFRNGRRILLQSLKPGQRVDVMCLSPEVSDRRPAAAEFIGVRR